MPQSDINNKPTGGWKQSWRKLPGVRDFSDLESARRAGARGAKVAFGCAVYILLLRPFPFSTPPDTGSIINGALFAGLGWGVWKMSRACAVSVMLVFIANFALNSGGSFGENWLGPPYGHLAMWTEEAFRGQPLTGFVGGFALLLETLVFGWLLAYFVEGVRGTFAYRRYMDNEAASAATSG